MNFSIKINGKSYFFKDFEKAKKVYNLLKENNYKDLAFFQKIGLFRKVKLHEVVK